jgi:hypothetical protein
MSQAEFYREQAAEALKMAAASNLPNVKTRFILAAEAWQRFAERAADVEAWQRQSGDKA